jgi:hypothetical protein
LQAAAALAYTQGDMISFSRGSFAPSTSAGQRLLAHELAHVVQQTRRSGSTLSTDSSAAEAEADAAAESIAAHRPPHVRLAVAAGVTQRQATTGTTRRSPTPTPLDAAAEAIVARTTTGSGDQKLRAVRLAYDILNAYYAGYASRVSGVGFDNKASAKLLGTEKRKASDGTYYGFIWVGDDFVGQLMADKFSFAAVVAEIGHELEHIDQYRSGMVADSQKNEREFLAYYHEATATGMPGTGAIHHNTRAARLDAAAGLYYCLDDAVRARPEYVKIKQDIDTQRPHHAKFGWAATHPNPPTTCTQPAAFR